MAGYAANYRDRSPDYTYAGGASIPAPSDYPQDRGPLPRELPQAYPPSPATGAWASPRDGRAYDTLTSPASLQVPHSSRSPRPRSLPPPIGWRSSRSRNGDDEEYYYRDDRERRDRDVGSRHRDRSRPRSRYDDDRDENKSPLEMARNMLKDTFTDSATGLGVGVVGALLGGLAAREAADVTARHGRQNSQDSNDEAAARRNQALATMVGAAVGALGANAVEKRLELGQDRDRSKQENRDRKYRSSSRGDENDRASLAPMDLKRRSGGGGSSDYEVIEKREIVARPRQRSRDDYDHDRLGGGSREIVIRSRAKEDDYDRRSAGWDWVDDAAAMESQVSRRESAKGNGRGAIEREIDPDAKSWRNVEDWVYSAGGPEGTERERDMIRNERERRYNGPRRDEERYRY